MERLLKDAEKLSGKKYDLSNLSDVYEAIHVIQGELGIAGATEEEAMKTIEGSAKMTKAAWENVITAIGKGEGVGDAFGGLMTALFGESEDTGLVNQLVPRIKTVLSTIADAIKENAPIIAEKLPELIEAILPTVIQGGITLASAIAGGILENLPAIFDSIVKGITTAIPQLEAPLSVLSEVLQGVFGFIVDHGDVIMGLLSGILGGFLAFKAVTDVLKAVTAAQQLLNLVLSANPIGIIVVAIGALVAAFVYLWNNCEDFRNFFIDMWEKIKAGFEATVEFFKNAFAAISEFAGKAWDGIKGFFGGIGNWFKEKFTAAKDAASKAWSGIKDKMSTSWENIKNAFSNVGDWFKEKFEKAKENSVNAWSNIKEKFGTVWKNIKSAFKLDDALTWGKDMLDNFIKGIKEKIGAVKEAVEGVADKIKQFLGFSEPEAGPLSNFHTFAPDMMELFAKGIKDNEDMLQRTVGEAFDFGGMIGNAPESGSGAIGGVTNVTMNIYGAQGQDVKQLAIEVSNILGGMTRRREVVW